ncbi:hypothetical protein [Porphyrobacter sp. YT40]|uniref:hypothetical protein n=1 Tax=Porphyrobacter sp. YT40 TaxID=2547601 RepID=UPI0011430CB3|nr:hypothetical protein [Porphyrobacter sp. YT40]QDH33977.1 hypothetical protein E2E27_06295 [Porphyrobacter sp. YT40]
MSRISDLPLAGPITGEETLPIVQGGTTKRTSVDGFLQELEEVAAEKAVQIEGLASDISANALTYVRSAQNLRRSVSTLALTAGGTNIVIGSNFTAFARGYLCGTDFAAGANIDGVRFMGDAPVITATLIERPANVANLEALPFSAGDVTVATATVTSAAYKAGGFFVPVPRYPARAGFYYLAVIECFA